jgi:hypothetical protein
MPIRQPAPRSATARPVLLSQLVGTPPCDADRVLLGCFGLNPSGTRSRHDLCTALHWPRFFIGVMGVAPNYSPVILIMVSRSWVGL